MELDERQAWRAFVKELKVHGEHGPMFSGILLFDSHGNVAYEEGWFKENSTHMYKEKLFAACSDVQMRTHRLDLNDTMTLHVVDNMYGNICAVGSSRKIGLISQNYSFGTLVVVFQWPYTLQTTFDTIEKFSKRWRALS